MNEFRSIIGISRLTKTFCSERNETKELSNHCQLQRAHSNSTVHHKFFLPVQPKSSTNINKTDAEDEKRQTDLEFEEEIPSFSLTESSNSRRKRVRRRSISVCSPRLSESSSCTNIKQQQNTSNISNCEMRNEREISPDTCNIQKSEGNDSDHILPKVYDDNGNSSTFFSTNVSDESTRVSNLNSFELKLEIEDEEDYIASIAGNLSLSLDGCMSTTDSDVFTFTAEYDDDEIHFADSLYEDGIIQWTESQSTNDGIDDGVNVGIVQNNDVCHENAHNDRILLPCMKTTLIYKSSFHSMFHSLNALDRQTIDKLIKQQFKSDNFREIKECGKGAFGIVNKAFHLPSCKVVAIKSSLSNDQSIINQFKKEITIFYELRDCPFIVNMIDCGFDLSTNQMNIALVFMDMLSLAKWKTKYTVDEIRCISYSVLSALQALHSLMYVHNDIKPDNILINHHFQIKLSDFGCAKKMDDCPLTIPVGSQKYRAYEMLFVSPVEYTTKADIYSLGITLYELWNGASAEDYVYYEPPVPYSSLDDNFVLFLQQCLQKDYHCRWNAEQLLLHPFFECNDSVSVEWSKKWEILNANAADLTFMIDSLADYYSTYVAADLLPIELTPIDHIFTDEERLQAMVEHTGYGTEEIENFIQEAVDQKTIDILRL